MRSIGGLVTATAAVWFCAGHALGGPDWIEGGVDAGKTLVTARLILGAGPLKTISGQLGESAGGSQVSGDPDYEDLFLLTISEPTMFSFTTTSADFDPQLFLFNVTIPGEALGLLANNDTAFGNLPLLTSPATDGSGAMVLLAGTYALGVSGLGRVPVSSTGPIFNFYSPFEVSGPDGAGGINALYDWTGIGQMGTYNIHLDGVDWYDVPTPGGCSVLLGACVLAARRRR